MMKYMNMKPRYVSRYPFTWVWDGYLCVYRKRGGKKW